MADNSDLSAKVAIRRWALAHAGDSKARVLELFGGEGQMHDACYQNVAKHLAFDLKGVERGTWLQGDNRVLIQQHVDGWTLYDADAYSNPWVILSDICRMRAKGEFVMVATCSNRRRMACGDPGAFFRWAGGYTLAKCPALMPRFYDDYIRAIFGLWAKYGVQVTACKRIKPNAWPFLSVFYYGLVAKKT